MTQLQDAIDRSIANHGAEYPAAHVDLLVWYDAKWPHPREAPEVLRVPPETFTAVMEGLGPAYRFSEPQLLEAGWPSVLLRPFGCRTSLVSDESTKEPTPDTIAALVAQPRPVAHGRPQLLHERPGGLKCLCGSLSCPNPAGKDDP